MPKQARERSDAFGAELKSIRNGRSYGEFAQFLENRTQISFSRSYLKRVEDGELAANPRLIYALERASGRAPGEMLRVAVVGTAHEVDRRDLPDHSRTKPSTPHTGDGVDDPSAREIADLRRQIERYKSLAEAAMSAASSLSRAIVAFEKAPLAEQGGSAHRPKRARHATARKAG